MTAVSAATGTMTFPPSEALQLFGAVTTLLLAPLLLVLAVCLRRTAPASRRALGDLGVVGVVLFAGMVSVNRFVQLTVVRQATADGSANEVTRFLPYDDGSVMFALELPVSSAGREGADRHGPAGDRATQCDLLTRRRRRRATAGRAGAWTTCPDPAWAGRTFPTTATLIWPGASGWRLVCGESSDSFHRQ